MKVVLAFALTYLAVALFLSRKKLPQLHPRRFFLETWLEVDRRAAQERALRAAVYGADGTLERKAQYDYRPLVVYVLLAVVLTLQEYTLLEGVTIKFGSRFGPKLTVFGPIKWMESERWYGLYEMGWWAVSRAGGYLLPPLILIPLWRQRYRDYGLRLKGFLEHAWIYALFFGGVLVLVVLVSLTKEFSSYYPFYREANRSWRDFFYWEGMYALQFFALEFYFRGFLLFSSESSLGSGVILAMVVPYCMIHFQKPPLETLGAIFAGTALGTLALKTRSIWSGFLIHVSVAVSMDVAALLQRDGLPGGLKLPASWNF